MTIRKISLTLALIAALPFCAYAQDVPSWSWDQAPPEALLKEGSDIIKVMLTTTDEDEMLNLVKRPGTDDAILRLKMFGYKRLGTHGTVKAIPVLVEKLDIEKEGFYARYALEMIPGEAVDTALSESLKDLKRPDAIAGVLTSLGVRANPKSAATAKSYLTAENADIRKAASYAYAQTAGDEAIEFFSNPKIDPILADSAFLLAEKYRKADKKDVAVKIYDALAAAEIEGYKKESAIFWGILTRGNDGIDLLVKQLQSDSPQFFAVGLKAARELPDGIVATKTLIAQISTEKDTFRKSLLVRALGGRTGKDAKALSLPVVTELAQSGEAAVRVAAIDTLRFIGDVSSLTLLFDATKNEETKAAAMKTLEELPGKPVDDAIVAFLTNGDSATEITAINLIQERRIQTDALEKELNSPNAAVKNAALKALGQTATIAELPALLKVLASAQGNTEEIVNILKSACTRIPQDAASSEVEKLFTAGSESVQLNLLELLKEIGGKKAVEIVEKAAWGSNVALQDKATEYLGNWRSPRDLDLIAAACLKLAKESRNGKYAKRGLSGYLRLARQFNMPEERRIAMCSEVFTLAKDDEKLKTQVVDVYWRFPSLKMLAETVKYLDGTSDEVKQQACKTAVTIGEKLDGKSPEMKAALEKVVEVAKDNEIKERAKSILVKQ